MSSRIVFEVEDFEDILQTLEVSIQKHGSHDQQSHGNWASGSENVVNNLSDDEIREVIYNSKTVDEMFHKVAKRLGKSMKPSVANLSENEITHYRGVQNTTRDAQRLLDGKVKFSEFQTWGQGIYLAEDKGIASNYGTLIKMKLDSSANIIRGESAWSKSFDVDYENPNARTRSTTTSNFIDFGKLENQINAGQKVNLSVSDMRNVYWASKGYDGFSTYGETVLFNGSKLTINKADIGLAVQKHGTHDQSSHGNWATDGSYPTEAVVSNSTWEAVHNYTNRGYKYLNVALRTNAELVDVDRGNIRGMDLVIKATPALKEDKTLLRGVSGGIANKLLESKVGDGFQDNGYMSTTGNANVAKFFSANQSDDYAMMVLDVPKGTKAFQPRKFFIGQDDGSDLWGALQAEDEYILARGTKFQITGIDKETRTVNVKVRT